MTTADLMKAFAPVFDLWRQGFELERQRGTPEAEIQDKVEQAIGIFERDCAANNVPAEMIAELRDTIRAMALPPITSPQIEC